MDRPPSDEAAAASNEQIAHAETETGESGDAISPDGDGPPATSKMKLETQPGADDEASRLRSLAADVRDQDDLERAIGRQVCPRLHASTCFANS